MNKTSFSVPILFLIFNRPEHTRKVFERIRMIQPQKLYVAADGPRKTKQGEPELCLSTREVVANIDWDCEVKTLYRDDNLGCKMAVSSAITWFFNNEPEGIILEDDCFPDPSFFTFCEIALDRYRHDTRVMHIGGANHQNGIQRGTGDYFFSKLTPIWGWASWRRAWDLYDIEMPGLQDFFKQDILKNIFWDRVVRNHFKRAYSKVKNGDNTWDYQWSYTCIRNGGISVIPQNNLVINIGFDSQATHGTIVSSDVTDVKLESISSFRPPLAFVPDQQADNYAMKRMGITLPIRIANRIKREIQSRIKRK